MKVYTLITARDPEALRRFADTIKGLPLEGVTLFARPDVVRPASLETAEKRRAMEKQARDLIDAGKVGDAAKAEKEAEALKLQEKAEARAAAAWIEEAITDIRKVTQLIVLGNLHWPPDVVFSVPSFFRRMEEISRALCGAGIGGIKHVTPLESRVFVPVPRQGNQVSPSVSAGPQTPPGESTQPKEPLGESARPGVPATSKGLRHPQVPESLSPGEARYAEKRLGLDRGGLVRSSEAASNLLGLSSKTGKLYDGLIKRKWPEFGALIQNMHDNVDAMLA